MRKIIPQHCQLCLFLKEAKLVQKYPQLHQLCLGSKLFQFMKENISQLCLSLKEAKLSQKYPQLCLGSDICPLWEKLNLNFANFACYKRFLSELCQLCFAYYIWKYIEICTNFANFASLWSLLKTCQLCLTFPNFAQLCILVTA